MRAIFDLGTLKRTYRDAVAWAILAVDLFPIVAVLTLGWGAAALVFLYWLENLIVGAVALAKMIGSSIHNGPLAIAGMFFLGPFFIVHYGMFCFVHGIFVAAFAEVQVGNSPDFFGPFGLINLALSSGVMMPMFISAIIGLQAFLYLRDFIGRGEYKKVPFDEHMIAPYGRVVVLHIGIFAGAFALAAIGEPLWGILALIGLRAMWGVFLTVRRRMRLDGTLPQQKVDDPSPI
ncbi:MAG: DUF6498-containing protein [Pseudomonadota bacterium]